MFYNTDHFFLLGWLKLNLILLLDQLRLVQGNQLLIVAVISVDAYPFLRFSDLTCNVEDTGVAVFGCAGPPDSKEI